MQGSLGKRKHASPFQASSHTVAKDIHWPKQVTGLNPKSQGREIDNQYMMKGVDIGRGDESDQCRKISFLFLRTRVDPSVVPC